MNTYSDIANYQDVYLPYPFRTCENLGKNKWAGHPLQHACSVASLFMRACMLWIDDMAANYSPTGHPRRERSRLAQRKRLFSEPQPVPSSAPEVWSDEENKALIEFVLFHCDPAVWPSHKKANKFWSDAANFVQQRSKASAKRTGS